METIRTERARLTQDKPDYFMADLLQVEVYADYVSAYVDARGGAGLVEDGPQTAVLQGGSVTIPILVDKPLPEPGSHVALKRIKDTPPT